MGAQVVGSTTKHDIQHTAFAMATDNQDIGAQLIHGMENGIPGIAMLQMSLDLYARGYERRRKLVELPLFLAMDLIANERCNLFSRFGLQMIDCRSIAIFNG